MKTTIPTADTDLYSKVFLPKKQYVEIRIKPEFSTIQQLILRLMSALF